MSNLAISKTRALSALAAARARSNPQISEKSPEAANFPEETTDYESGNGSLTDEEEDQPDNINYRLCDWIYSPKKVVSSSDKETTLKIDHNETITHIGSYDFVVLQGRVSIEGVNALPSDESASYRVHAPTTHYISQIRGLAKNNVVRFLDVSDDGVRQLSDLNQFYRRIWNAKSRNESSLSFTRITEVKADPYQRVLLPDMMNRDYQSAVDDAVTNSKSVMVCGARYSGKSALARRLANAYLTGPSTSNQLKSGRSIMYLDLDSHLPEFTPHGQLSLVLVKEVALGPSFTHPAPVPGSRQDVNELLRAHPFPEDDYAQNLAYFYACARDLIDTARSLQPKGSLPIPIVINTPSWTSLRSVDHLIKLIRLLCASRVILIDGNNESVSNLAIGNRNTLEEDEMKSLMDACENLTPNPFTNRTVFRVLQSQTNLKPSTEDFVQQSMHMLSYFHCTGLSGSKPPHRTYDTKPLSFMRPWTLRYDSQDEDRDGCIGVLMLGDHISPDSIGSVLNTSVVQVVETNDFATLEQYGNLPRTKCGLPYFPHDVDDSIKLPDPKSSKLLFTALVRSYRPEEKLFLLIIPESHQSVAAQIDPKKIILVFGCCSYPGWALTEDPNWDAAQKFKKLEKASADGHNLPAPQIKKRFKFDAKMEARKDDEEVDEITMREVVESVEIPPWVTTEEIMAPYRHLNVPRRTRRFHQ